jgi:hypothetical protein
MPVRKFRDVSEMEDVWYPPGDPRLIQALRNLWSFAASVCQPRFPPGVYKHRSIEELNAQTERWQEANFRAFQARRAEQARKAAPESEAEEAAPAAK